MIWAWLLLLGIAVALVTAIALQGAQERRPDADPGDPDQLAEAWYSLLGIENGAEEAVERRLRLVDLARRRVARIGRRPRP